MAEQIPIRGLVGFVPNSVIEQEKAESQKPPTTETPKVINNLASYIRDCWEKAKKAKEPIKNKLISQARAFKSEYTSEKLAAIRSIGGSEVFVPLTNIKCRAAEAWVREIIFQPNEIPWDIRPTPEPELPESIKAQIISKLLSVYEQVSSLMVSGVIPQEQVQRYLSDLSGKLKDSYEKEVKRKAKEIAESVKSKIQDKLVEGGFYEALEDVIHDLAIYSCAFLKGPIYRKSKKVSLVNGVPSVIEEVTMQFERRSPFDIYPAPDSTDIDDGFLIDRVSISPKELSELRGVEGFNSVAIVEVLDKYKDNGLKEWTTEILDRIDIENKDSSVLYASDKIDALEFWGEVKGELLIKYGMSEEEIDDPNKYYSICAWLIDNKVIKAMLNYDPLGHKPYAKASFVEVSGSFWGISIADILEPLQGACNAVARAIVNNAALASGPLIERNVDRVPSYDLSSKAIIPWKIFDSTDTQMNSSPAYRFYSPPFIADRLIMTLQSFMKMADETSSIPAYAHGDITVGGAGRTASGLSMLTASANRGIKAVIRNIDVGILEDVVKRMYIIGLINGDFGEVPDMSIVAKGSVALMEKELQSVRRTEFLQATANQFDMQILGLTGRKMLLEETAKAHGIDVDKLFGQELLSSPPIPPQLPEQSGEEKQEQAGKSKQKSKPMRGGRPTHGLDIQQFKGGK